MSQFDAYVIVTSPRSGSTLLCKMLTATACAGVPESYFHTPSVADWLKEYGLRQAGYPNSVAALRAVFAQVSKQGRGATKLFGLRVQRPSFAFLVQHMALLFPEAKTDLARFEAAFGRTRFVHLTRQDKLAQAVSMVRAEQTGLWHRHADGRELERLAPASAPIYDRLAIAQKMALLATKPNFSSANCGKIDLSKPTIPPTNMLRITSKENCFQFSFNPNLICSINYP